MKSSNNEYWNEYRKKRQKTPIGKFNVYKQNAKVRGLEFNLNFEEFKNLIITNCYYCGGDGYGIDRIDNSIGYTKNNCFSCCTICNKMKSNMNIETFIKQCKNISNNL